MNAGQYLASLSGIGAAPAMAHLLAIQAGGAGLVINDGVLFVLEDAPFDLEVATVEIDLSIEDAPAELVLEDGGIEVLVEDEAPVLEILE